MIMTKLPTIHTLRINMVTYISSRCVIYFQNQAVCMQLTCATTRDAIHI